MAKMSQSVMEVWSIDLSLKLSCHVRNDFTHRLSQEAILPISHWADLSESSPPRRNNKSFSLRPLPTLSLHNGQGLLIIRNFPHEHKYDLWPLSPFTTPVVAASLGYVLIRLWKSHEVLLLHESSDPADLGYLSLKYTFTTFEELHGACREKKKTD